jgi:hypothetical protein
MPFLSYPQALQLRKALERTNAEVVTLASDDFVESLSQSSDTYKKEAVGDSSSHGSPFHNVHKHLFASTNVSLEQPDATLIKGVIVKVTSADEVSKVVSFATKRNIPFVVYATGYNTSGASSTYGGVVISLEKMRKVLIDPVTKTVTVQGGARWEDVNIAAAQQGLAVVGATASHLGVGGTTLGGGFGWLTGRYGLIVDNLLSVQMVLADTHIVTASETENPDLFWATRGAGQDFGVVTEFHFKAYPQKNPVYAGLLYFTADKLPKVVEFANQFDTRTDGDQGFFFGFTGFMEASAVVVMVFYNGPREKAEKFFEPLLSLDSILNETDMVPYFKANDVINRIAAIRGRKRFSGTNIRLPLDIEFVQEIYDDFNQIMKTYPGVSESILIFEMLPYIQVIKVPINATAYANRGRYYNVGSIFCWHHEELDTKMQTLQRDMMNKIRKKGVHESEQGVGVYANYTGMLATLKPVQSKGVRTYVLINVPADTI